MRPEDSGGDSICASGAHPRTNCGAGCSYPFATDHGGNDGIGADHTRAESHGQIVDVPTPQIQEEIAAVIQVIPQERVSERILEQTRRCSSPLDSRTICRNLEDHPTGPGSAAHGGADCCSSSSAHREHAPNDVVVKVPRAKLQRVSSEDCRTPVCGQAVKQSAEMQSALEFFATALSSCERPVSVDSVVAGSVARVGAACCAEKLEGNRGLQERCPLVADRAR